MTSTMVVLVPKREKIEANSLPTAPAPEVRSWKKCSRAGSADFGGDEGCGRDVEPLCGKGSGMFHVKHDRIGRAFRGPLGPFIGTMRTFNGTMRRFIVPRSAGTERAPA